MIRKYVTAVIQKITKGLLEVDLQSNSLNLDEITAIVEIIISNGNKILKLDLSCCNIPMGGIKLLLPILDLKTTNLLTLNLRGNSISAKEFQELIGLLQRNKTLTRLGLKDVKLFPSDMILLKNLMKTNRNLCISGIEGLTALDNTPSVANRDSEKTQKTTKEVEVIKKVSAETKPKTTTTQDAKDKKASTSPRKKEPESKKRKSTEDHPKVKKPKISDKKRYKRQ